ncbi:MAG TPA: NAD(P)-dependent oxidoreductase, partial [Planctomycetota bacterium]|nr:NAD(P)-dependent oxidoreductase [Planctomycetota bacterium]
MNMEIKRILVTGASGKIGRNLLPALVGAGYKVRATEFRRPVKCDGVEVVAGSVSDETFVNTAVDGMDAIVHLATRKEDKEALVDVSVRGTLNLLEACRDNPRLRQFIISSGDAAQGIFFYPNPVPINENMPLRAYRGYYALSKVLEDTLVEQYGIQYGVPWTILRFSWIHDDDDLLCYMTFAKPDFGGPSWKSLAKTPEQMKHFEEGRDGVGCLVHPGGKPYVRHIVSVHDVVHSILVALGNPQAMCQAFNVAAPSAFSYDVL